MKTTLFDFLSKTIDIDYLEWKVVKKTKNGYINLFKGTTNDLLNSLMIFKYSELLIIDFKKEVLVVGEIVDEIIYTYNNL